MRLATCRYRGEIFPAMPDGDGLALLRPVPGGVLRLAAAPGDVDIVRRVGSDDVEFLLPVTSPAKIVCVGLNYRDHAQEAAVEPQTHPSLFPRFADTLVGHRQAVVAPSISTQFDYEGELAVIIGRRAWRVATADALGHVAGYACLAENSVRDFQFHSRQVTPGKNFPASGALGPWLTTADEVPDPSALELMTRLNGEVVQQASLADLIFDVPSLIAYVSLFTPLMPGDVIATGTPAGVGGARKPPLWLKPGDTLEVEIPGVGHLVNPIVAEGDGQPSI